MTQLKACASDYAIYGIIGLTPCFETEDGPNRGREKSKKNGSRQKVISWTIPDLKLNEESNQGSLMVINPHFNGEGKVCDL